MKDGHNNYFKFIMENAIILVVEDYLNISFHDFYVAGKVYVTWKFIGLNMLPRGMIMLRQTETRF